MPARLVAVIVVPKTIEQARDSRHEGAPEGPADPRPAQRRHGAVAGSAVVGGGTGPSTTLDDPTLLPRHYDVGQCVIWDEGDSKGDGPFGAFPRSTMVVRCDEAHFFEIVGDLRVADGPAYPSDERWNEIFDKASSGCRPLAERYLNGPVDPYGRFRVSGMKPGPALWAKGSRQVWCAVAGRHDPGDDDTGRQTLLRGSARDQSQTRTHRAGSCMAFPEGSDQVSETIPCRRSHAFEVAGTVDIGDRTPERPASNEAWRAALGTDCRILAETYLARPIDGKTIRWTYFEIRPESWAAGRREVECLVGRFDAEAKVVSVEGPLRDRID